MPMHVQVPGKNHSYNITDIWDSIACWSMHAAEDPYDAFF